MSRISAAVGTRFEPYEFDYTESDTIIYALAVGAGRQDDDLRFVYERDLIALPTQPVVAASPLFEQLSEILGIDRRAKVHGEQRLRLHRPPPVSGRLRVEATIDGVWDRGSGAVVDITANFSVDGQRLASAVFSSFVRGEGGFGGERGPRLLAAALDSPPDAVVTETTRTDQAMLYRLTGDRNPLHIDPDYAQEAGFDRPIMHGLCTYGFGVRMAMRAIPVVDASSIIAADARFVSPVFPGDVLRLEMWRRGPTQAYGRLSIEGRAQPAIDPLFITVLDPASE